MKYITLETGQGQDFRKIAKIMSSKNFVMNHATARNVLCSALKMLLQNLSTQFNLKMSEEKMEEMLRSQQLHDALSDVLINAHKEMQAKNRQ